MNSFYYTCLYLTCYSPIPPLTITYLQGTCKSLGPASKILVACLLSHSPAFFLCSTHSESHVIFRLRYLGMYLHPCFLLVCPLLLGDTVQAFLGTTILCTPTRRKLPPFELRIKATLTSLSSQYLTSTKPALHRSPIKPEGKTRLHKNFKVKQTTLDYPKAVSSIYCKKILV